MIIYIAMAELEDGSRSIERAYLNRDAAEQAVQLMIKELEEQTHWTNMIPIIEEIELVNE